MKRGELSEILSPVSKFVAGLSGSILTFQHLCFKGNFVLAYNGESGYCAPCPLGIECTVPSARFLSLLDKMDKDAEVSISMQGPRMRLVCLGSTATLQTGDVTSYPDWIPDKHSLVGTPGNLLDAFRVCSDLIDRKARNQFQGVYLRGQYAYSTDGLRATRFTLDASVSGSVYIPLRSAQSLLNLRPPARLISWQSMIGAVFDDPVGLWCSATLAGDFPADSIDGFFVQGLQDKYIAEFPEDVLPAMRRLQIMTDDDRSGIDVVSESGNLQFSARVREGGELVENFAWRFPHPFRFRVNPIHFLHGLNVSRRVDLTEVCGGSSRRIRFAGAGGVDHLMSLTA